MTCQEIIQKMIDNETDTKKLEAMEDFCYIYNEGFRDVNGIDAYNKCKKLIDIWPEMMALLLSLSICGVKNNMTDFEDFKYINEIDMDEFFSEE